MNTTIPVHPSLKGFSRIMESRTAEERHELAHIKRFAEYVAGDPVFRQKLEDNIDNPAVVAREYNLDVDPDLLRPLFHIPYMAYRFQNADDRWPLAKKWDAYVQEMLKNRDEIVHASSTAEVNPLFDKWRQRQMSRLRSELGTGQSGIVHPIAAYELSRGCSVGCWFCGISADKFKGHLPFTEENEKLWRGILEAMVERFGAAAQTGFCYWATDPADNPDYVKYMKVHHEITGVVPQTTTAAPLRNLALTREVLQLFNEHKCVVNRFSIVSIGQFRKVLATFTPEELLGVELVLQHKGALTVKAAAGRALEQSPLSPAAAKRNSGEDKPGVVKGNAASATPEASDGTIACVTGFLVRPLEGTVQLVSPTRATKKWPDGYRIYGEATFSNAREFGAAIDELVAAHIAKPLRGADQLAFRNDLGFRRQANGFRVLNDRTSVDVCGRHWIGALGESIRSGTKTVAQVTAEVCAMGANVFEITGVLNDIYQAGFLDDDPAARQADRPTA
jgi:radical SAM family RiPP maturation amino acid epimerase